MALTDIVKNILQDSSGILNSILSDFILSAVNFHSLTLPRRVFTTVVGTGAYEYSIPTAFDINFSEIIRIEYPSGKRTPEYINTSEVIIYNRSKIRFLSLTPATTESFIIEHTKQWTAASIEADLPANDLCPFAYLVASMCAKTLALYYSQLSDPTISVDMTGYSGISERYAQRSNELYGFYKSYFGIEGKVAKPLSSFIDYNYFSPGFTHA